MTPQCVGRPTGTRTPTVGVKTRYATSYAMDQDQPVVIATRFRLFILLFSFPLVGVEGLEPSMPEGAWVTTRYGCQFRVTPKTKKAT